jgi:3-oxoacyl-(acyl-carrier-protein) synthase
MNEVVITGYGIVAPIGADIAEFSRRMFAADSGTIDIRGRWVAPDFPIAAAAVVPREQLGLPSILAHRPPASTPDSWRFACLATEQAIHDLPPGHRVDAIVYATADGTSFDAIRESFRTGFHPDHFAWETTRSESGVGWLRALIEQHGHGAIPDEAVIAMNNACVSGNQAIGTAFRRIRAGQWTRAVVGGVDARCYADNLMNFHLLGALTTADVPAREASRPFSTDRSGFVRGEGAATLILETRHAAEARGARVLGAVAGYASTADAYRLTDGRPDGQAVVQAMGRALEDGGVAIEEVSAISAHGTSTRMNDRLETQAIKALFGARAYHIPVTSLKSQVGHSTVAAGALEAVSAVLMLQHQRLAPTINYRGDDPDCDLDYVPNESRAASLEAILSNSFGFGGQNACVVFRKAGR